LELVFKNHPAKQAVHGARRADAKYFQRLPAAAAVICRCSPHLSPVGGDGKRLLHVDHYNNVGAENYERMVSMAEEFAERTPGRSCRQTNNLLPPDTKTSCRKSSISTFHSTWGAHVAVARLHHRLGDGAAACSRSPAITRLSRLYETRRCLGEWVCGLDEVDHCRARLEKLPEQKLRWNYRRRPAAEPSRARKKLMRCMPAKSFEDGGQERERLNESHRHRHDRKLSGLVAWCGDYAQYALGLERRLGYEVFYLEGTRAGKTYDPRKGEMAKIVVCR